MEENFRDLLATVNFIKDHMATKDDLAEALGEVEGHLTTRIDRLDATIERVDTKLTKFEESEIDKRLQLEVRVTRVEKHLDLPKPQHA